MTASTGRFDPLDAPVWYAPLRSPTWLVPALKDAAPQIVFGAEPWGEPGVDGAGRDLRLGLPIFLAEATRFGTDARTLARTSPIDGDETATGARAIVRTSVAPGGRGSVRIRVTDGEGGPLAEIEHEAADERALGLALADLPREVTMALAPAGVRTFWSSIYAVPPPALVPAYVRGLHASVRVLRDTVDPSDIEAIGRRREEVRTVLSDLGSLATSAHEACCALSFFGALLAGYDHRSSVVGEFRLPANARCTAATDPRDPVYAITALAMRIFGDVSTSERRIRELEAGAEPAMRAWLARVREMT